MLFPIGQANIAYLEFKIMILSSTLIQPPKWGVLSRWPVDPDDWVHPEDVATASELIPSYRVVRREIHDNEYNLIRYGKRSFRAKPVLWLEIRRPPFEVGDFVQVSGLFGIEDPILGTINEVIWNPRRRFFEFQLHTVAGRHATKLFREQDLLRVTRLNAHLVEKRPLTTPENLNAKLVGV